MPKIVVSNIVSLDGFYAAPDGNPLLLNMDEAFDLYNRERIEDAGTVLLGRESFLGFSSYWPDIADAPDDPDNRALDDDNRRISRAYNRVAKVVVSDTLVVPEDNAWHSTTTVIPRSGLSAWVAEHRTNGSADAVVFGSRVMWNALLVEGLLDEIHLMVSPTALGAGIPLFAGATDLTLLGTRQFDGSDNVLLRYAPRAPR
ncbi:dihydrofolate reductase family protein [Mycetocola sp. 2940]|uniref:dihydrofolate reductase family protein n=1 Tax=Mycetocola sp. 2940 TaxID=3156452 RepID=UPI00339B1CFC